MKHIKQWLTQVNHNFSEHHIRLLLWLLTFALIALIGGAPEVSGSCNVC